MVKNHLPAPHAVAAHAAHLAGFTHGGSGLGLLVLVVVLVIAAFAALHRPHGTWW